MEKESVIPIPPNRAGIEKRIEIVIEGLQTSKTGMQKPDGNIRPWVQKDWTIETKQSTSLTNWDTCSSAWNPDTGILL